MCLYLYTYIQSWAYCAEERKSASPEAFFCCVATLTQVFKGAIVLFALLDAILIATFMTEFGMENCKCIGSQSLAVKYSAQKTDDTGSTLPEIGNRLTLIYFINKIVFAFLAL